MTSATSKASAGDHTEPLLFHGRRAQDEVTRLLSAQAFLGGRSFREKVLGFFRSREDATAPEHGLNVRLLTQVCLAAEREQAPFDRAFVAAAAVCLCGFVATWMLPLGLIATGAVNVGMHHLARARARIFLRSKFDHAVCVREFGSEVVPEPIEASLPRDDQNVVLYSGFVPFVGAGSPQGFWSFNCALKAPRDLGSKQGVIPFATNELYSHIKSSLEAMSIPNLQCIDRLFVNGCEARGLGSLCEGNSLRPLQVLSGSGLAQCINANDERIRHYLCVQVADWGGEVITTFFIRFVLRGNGLYVELNRFLLCPVEDAYRKVDKLADLGFTGRLVRAAIELAAGPLQAVGACLAMASRVMHACADLLHVDRRRAARRRRIAREPDYDFGASESLRELLSRPLWRHYFQRSDEDFTRKLIERNLLDEIANFLEEHGFDSTDIRERRTTILNNGIIVNGGDVRSDALAVGAGATASKSVSTKKEAAAV